MIRKRILLALALTIGVYFFYQMNYELPVLMYHRVDDCVEPSSTCVSPETFERQMEFLKVHGYRVMSLAALFGRLQSDKPLPKNAVVITFDDGTLDNFKYAFPVLKEMNFPATVFMITENIGKEGWLSPEDIRIMDSSGVSIGSHTVHHAYLPERTEAQAVQEIRGSKQALERILHRPVTLFSYPAGGFTPQVKALVEKEGYAGAVTTNRGTARHDRYALHRIKISESRGNLFSFWIKTSGLYHIGKKRIRVEEGRPA